MSPYSGWIIRGPSFDKKSGRWRVRLIGPNGEDEVTLFSRYIMEITLGRKLLPYEEVHHKDEDKTNDVLTNLEVKIRADHMAEHVDRIHYDEILECVSCDTKVNLTSRQMATLRSHQRNGHAGPFCNKYCRRAYQKQFKEP